MAEDFYVIAIAALLPLTGCMVVFQVNPYHALVIRGILGAIAALVYILFGAADVALTEALVGTMLSVTLYTIAVRSSLSMRLGVLEDGSSPVGVQQMSQLEPLRSALLKPLNKYQMRLELIEYPSAEALKTALVTKEVHSISVAAQQPSIAPVSLAEQVSLAEEEQALPTNTQPLYHIQTRVSRLYEILQVDLSPTIASLTYINPADLSQIDAHSSRRKVNPVEVP